MATDPTKQKTWAFLLVVVGFLAMFTGSPVIGGLGVLTLVIGFVMFIAARLKQ